MNEQFDKTLRDHIRDTFDHFDDQMANDGWKKFNQSKKRKRRAVIFWYGLPTGMAAALALLWTINIYNTGINEQTNDQVLVQQIEKTAIEQKANPPQLNTERTNNPKKQEDVAKATLEAAVSENPVPSSDPKNNSQQNRSLATNKVNNTASPTEASLAKNTAVANLKSNVIEPKVMEISPDETKVIPTSENERTILATVNPIAVKDYVETISSPILSNPKKQTSISPIRQTQLAYTSLPPAIEPESLEMRESNLVAKEKNYITNSVQTAPFRVNELSKEPLREVMGKNKKFNLSIDANTYVNFSAAGLNDQINLGIGLASELKLTKNISLNSGVLLNRQTTTFDGNQRSSLDFKLASSNFNFAAVPKAQITNAKMVGIDIPLNLKLSLNLGKTDAFITSGISSYSVINEKYINDFSVVNYSITGVNTTNVRTVQDNPAGGNFSYFKFARTVNFSFGIISNLSKKSTLSVEPFIKYPLSGLGYQDLKIGSGGLSFKLNFGK